MRQIDFVAIAGWFGAWLTRRQVSVVCCHASAQTILIAASGINNSKDASCSRAALNMRRLWLYSLVPADYDGALVLPHWIQHYNSIGVPLSRMMFLVHHNPKTYPSSKGLEDVLEILTAQNLQHRSVLVFSACMVSTACFCFATPLDLPSSTLI